MTLLMSVRHHTGFTYDGVAKSSYNEARMTPITTATQRVHESRLSVSPLTVINTYRDYFGTIVSSFDLQEPHQRLDVEARSFVECEDATLPNALSWRELMSETRRDEFAEYLATSARTRVDVEGFSLPELDVAQRSVHDVAEAIADFVRQEVDYVPGSTTVSSTAQEAWARRQGVCQDLTHVTLGLLRGVGVPARYVSGYLYPQRADINGVAVEGQSHAWIEYFCGAWVGIDPTNGLHKTERHVVVARGRDYDDVAPLKGVYEGPRSSMLGVVVEMVAHSAEDERVRSSY
ncbi:MAG TPA: transglutaminase family protein [Acidimicrobiales bacterium]|nr:transglutaminase family protein [Acidimicrobiales bacterium]